MSSKVFTPPPIFPLARGGSQKEILQMSSKVLTPPPALPLVRGGSQKEILQMIETCCSKDS